MREKLKEESNFYEFLAIPVILRAGPSQKDMSHLSTIETLGKPLIRS
jgi:hypothetical protein